MNVNVEKVMKYWLVFNYKQADYQKIHIELIDINWVVQLKGTSEESWNYLGSEMHELINKYIANELSNELAVPLTIID